ncbi:GspH/FimT family protein [Methylophaga sp.]|uniref:GspH/FimT family protein n=1 Tax=Methylophaga sp. TaxID=2024840 RepID=UPI003A8D0136
MIESNRLTSTTNSTLGLLNYARGEAVRHGEPVRVQARDGGLQNGLEVVLVSDDDDPIRVGHKLPGAVTLVLQSGDMPRFNGRGEKAGDNNTVFRICPGNGKAGVDIVVNRGGQANRAQAEPACS